MEDNRGLGGVGGGYFRGDWAFEGTACSHPGWSINQGGPTWPGTRSHLARHQVDQIGCRGESSQHSSNSKYTPTPRAREMRHIRGDDGVPATNHCRTQKRLDDPG